MVDVRFKLLFGFEVFVESFIVGFEFFSFYRDCQCLVFKFKQLRGWFIVDYVFDFSGREFVDGVGDGDVGVVVGGFFSGGNFEDIVDIDFEDDFKDGFVSFYGRDRSKGEFIQGGVVFVVDMFILVNGELNGLLVVGNSGESLFFDGGDSLVMGDDGGEDVVFYGDIKGERNDI